MLPTVPERVFLPLLLALLPGLATVASGQGRTVRVSVAWDGSQAVERSQGGSVSADGRFVAFVSADPDLVPGGASPWNVFLRDLTSGSTTLVSVTSSGTPSDDGSTTPAISADGSVVAFDNLASNLVPGDGNDARDVFVRVLGTGTTERISVDSNGVEGNADSFHPSISADGSRVAFLSQATNLVSPPPPNHQPRVYVRDRSTGQTLLASVDGYGQPTGSIFGPSISADGRFVAFIGCCSHVLPGDTGLIGYQIYVRDLLAGVTTRESVNSAGVPARWPDIAWAPSISGDGRFVAFESGAANLAPGDDGAYVDVFVHDRVTGETARVSATPAGGAANQRSDTARISADGRYVAFRSWASDLVPHDTNDRADAFVHDRLTGTTTRVSVSDDGGEGGGVPPAVPAEAVVDDLSPDGRFVVYTSNFSNLVPGDTNLVNDVFLHDRAAPRPNAYCTATLDSRGCLSSIASTGIASASVTAAFDIRASGVQAGRRAFLCYSLVPDREPFLGGLLCIAPPLRRAAVLTSGGDAAAHDCTGSLSYDFNARIRAGVDPDLVPGTVGYAQYLYRDPAAPPGLGTGLSDALRFAIQP